MKEIQLSGKYITLVNDEDFERIKNFHWGILVGGRKTNKKLYAVTHKGKKKILLHRFLLNPSSQLVLDHINGNGLDNRRENLRICTRSQNNQNSKRSRKNKVGYKGVYFFRERKKYRAQIHKEDNQIYLGDFDNLIEAAQAYDKAARELFGKYALTNF